MKYALLVAWREYAESAKAKGFWLGILLIPAIFFLSIQAPIWLEQKATPVRHFVMLDQSGSLRGAIETDLEKAYQTRVLQALQEYARKNTPPPNGSDQRTNAAANAGYARNVDGFIKDGGQDAFLKKLGPRLKPGAPPFQAPRRNYRAVSLPAEVNTDADLATIADQLKPYLRGEKRIQVDGAEVNLAAAVLIPRDIQSHIARPVSKAAATNSNSSVGGNGVDEWRGTLEAGQASLRLVLKVRMAANGMRTATLDSLDQGAFNIPVSNITTDGHILRFEVNSIQGAYEGTLDKAGTEAVGHWTQTGQSLPLTLALMQSASTPHVATVITDTSGGTKSPETRPSLVDTSAVQFWSVNASDPALRDEIERAMNSEVRQREYVARGLDSKVIRQVEQTYVPFASLNPKKEKGKESVSAVDTIRQWAPSAFVYLLWLSIFMIVQMLLTNTIEEKSNRIIEVLLSSVTPGELMIGKLFGIAAIGLTMIAAWMFAAFGILSWKAGGSSVLAGQILAVLKGSNLIFVFTLYFILGYLMYAGFILALGSVCNTLKEAQSYMGVLTMIMMVPLMTMTFIPKDPNGPIARVLSWIPLYTPFAMMNRASADPPAVDLVGTFVLLMICTVGAMWMAGKIFRIGILRTGQPPKILEMLRWALRKS